MLTDATWQGADLRQLIADQLLQDNPRFDRSRFIDACQLDAVRLA